MSIPVNPPDPPTNEFPAVTLSYNNRQPPIGLLALVHLVTPPSSSLSSSLTLSPSSSASPPTLTFTAPATVLQGSPFLLRYFARVLSTSPHLSLSPSLSSHLYGDNPLHSTLVDHLLTLSPHLSLKDTLLTYADHLNAHLTHHTFLVSHHLTIADLAVLDALQSNPRWAAFTKPTPATPSTPAVATLHSYPALHRWYHHLLSLPFLSSSLTLKSSLDEQKAQAKLAQSTTGSFDVDLGDTSTVVTRFPPEPSGYLHIGHAKSELTHSAHSLPPPLPLTVLTCLAPLCGVGLRC